MFLGSYLDKNEGGVEMDRKDLEEMEADVLRQDGGKAGTDHKEDRAGSGQTT